MADLYDYKTLDGKMVRGVPLLEVLKMRQRDMASRFMSSITPDTDIETARQMAAQQGVQGDESVQAFLKSMEQRSNQAKAQKVAGSMRDLAGPQYELDMNKFGEIMNTPADSLASMADSDFNKRYGKVTGYKNPTMAAAADAVEATGDVGTKDNVVGSLMDMMKEEMTNSRERTKMMTDLWKETKGTNQITSSQGTPGNLTPDQIMGGDYQVGTERLPAQVSRSEQTIRTIGGSDAGSSKDLIGLLGQFTNTINALKESPLDEVTKANLINKVTSLVDQEANRKGYKVPGGIPEDQRVKIQFLQQELDRMNKKDPKYEQVERALSALKLQNGITAE